MKQQTTKNKVKVIGTEQYINVSTGELEEMQVTTIEERDYNFTKIWMKNLILTMDIVGNQKTKFCFWLIDHLNRDNILIGTQRDMAEDVFSSFPKMLKREELSAGVCFCLLYLPRSICKIPHIKARSDKLLFA